jgi:hypothetical protein
MRIKGTMLRTRLEFVRERYGPEAPPSVLGALSAEERRLVQSALPGSWLPFSLLSHIDQEIVRRFGDGNAEVCREIGAFSAHRTLVTVYRVFVEQAEGDPQRLMEGMSTLHATFYDWGSMRATSAGERLCRVESDYQGGATRANCLTAVGFYGEALRQLAVRGAQVLERGCQALGAPLCLYEVTWET